MLISIKIKYVLETRSICCDTEMLLSDLKLMVSSIFNLDESLLILSLNDRNLFDDKKTLLQHGLVDDATVVASLRSVAGPGAKRFDTKSIVSNPMFKNLMNDPDGLKNMMGMFQDGNDSSNSIFNNPQVLEEMQKIAEDPDYLNTAAKNADVAMARLDTIPGGLNYIQSMVNDIPDLNKKNLQTGINVNVPMKDEIPNENVRVNWLVKYRKELNDLKKLGFTDIQRNVNALKQSNGDIEKTIRILTGV